MDRIQVIALAAALFFLGQVLWFTARRRFRDRQAFLWIMLALAVVGTAASIPLLNRAAERIGVAYMPALVFMLGFFVMLTLMMVQASSLSVQQEKLKNVVQELAILRLELEEVKERLPGGGRTP